MSTSYSQLLLFAPWYLIYVFGGVWHLPHIWRAQLQKSWPWVEKKPTTSFKIRKAGYIILFFYCKTRKRRREKRARLYPEAQVISCWSKQWGSSFSYNPTLVAVSQECRQGQEARAWDALSSLPDFYLSVGINTQKRITFISYHKFLSL